MQMLERQTANSYNYKVGESQTTRRAFSQKKPLYCKTCDKFVKVTEQETGKQYGTDASGEPFTIFVNLTIGECGHVVRDDSS